MTAPADHNANIKPKEQWVWADRLFTGKAQTPLENHIVEITHDVISAIKPATDEDAKREWRRFPIIAPGFIDLQINGAGGVMFNDEPDTATINQMAMSATVGGSCHILPTFITAHGNAYEQALRAVDECDCANVLGLHLEGPFLSSQRPGIHPVDAIRDMTKKDVDVLVDHLTAKMTPHNKRLILTIAPEQVDPLLLDRLIMAGVIVFAGHSNASTTQMIKATDQGVSGITHLFNACSQITARAPGIVGTALTDPRLSAGIIADGFHVAPRLLKLAAQLMTDRLCLVSDTMPTFASDLTDFRVGNNKISLVDGRLQAEDGTLAGAHLGLDQAVANMCTLAGVSLADALNMASGVPAKILGMTDLYGQIDVGRPASLTCLAENLTCLDVFVHGKQQRKN